MTVNASAVSPKDPPGTRTNVRRNPTDPSWLAHPAWVHPQFSFWFPEWKLIRDAIGGEKDVKLEGEWYLPRLEDQDDDEYNGYISRATYYNFSSRTQKAWVGTLFKRMPSIDGLPKGLVDELESVTRDNQSFTTFAKQVTSEITSIGRLGVLVDLPATLSPNPKPYFALYTAEHICDWDAIEIDGRDVLSKVVLREMKLADVTVANTSTTQRKYLVTYRELLLVLRPDPNRDGLTKWTYVQRLYEAKGVDADYKKDAYVEIVPMRRGETLERIPFRFFSPEGSDPNVKKPTMQDICRLNISHYRSYAHLEHGRFFTGFPIYYIEMGNGEGDDYRIGSSRVWEAPMGSKPGILEFNGNGLKFLENALEQKADQASALGGRMIGVRGQSTGESDNQVKLKERNEQATLLDISLNLDEGLTFLLRLWAWMQDATEAEMKGISLTFSKDFLFEQTGAREFRAIQSMYKDGLIPIQVVYEYLKKALVVPDWMSMEEFQQLLDDPKNFPMQPDADARAEGYPDMASKLKYEDVPADVQAELDSAEQIAADAQKAAADAAEKARKAQADLAAKQAKAGVQPTAPGQRPGAPMQRPPAAKLPVKPPVK